MLHQVTSKSLCRLCATLSQNLPLGLSKDASGPDRTTNHVTIDQERALWRLHQVCILVVLRLALLSSATIVYFNSNSSRFSLTQVLMI